MLVNYSASLIHFPQIEVTLALVRALLTKEDHEEGDNVVPNIFDLCDQPARSVRQVWKCGC